MPKVLVIDDSELALKWAQDNLPKYGFEVVTYKNTFGVTNVIQSTQPDIVLLDVNMYGIKVNALCGVLRKIPSTKDIPVALYSSMSQEELKTLAEKCEACGYIEKTQQPEIVANHIKNFLQKKDAD